MKKGRKKGREEGGERKEGNRNNSTNKMSLHEIYFKTEYFC